jgi:hypothetical protein
LSQTAAAQSTDRSLQIQTQDPRAVGDRRIRYLGIGAGIGGALAFGYYQMSDKGARSGRCKPLSCALPYLTISGGISGLFFARELAAQRRAELPRAGEALVFRTASIALPSAALAMAVRDSLFVAATDSGAQVFSALSSVSGLRPSGLRRRGAGLSDLRSVAIGGTDPRLYIGTGSALWETPLTTGLLSRVMGGPVDVLGANGNVVVAAIGNSLRVRRTTAGEARIDSLNAPTAITSAHFDRAGNTWWVTSDSLLFELTIPAGDTERPMLTERAAFTGQARAVATSPSWIAVALGGDGLLIWQRTSLTARSGVVSPIALRGEPRFAFGLAFVGDELFVAGGVDGITRVELSPVPRIVGSSRQAGYATTILAADGVLWVGDRNGNRILRIVP